MVEQSVVKLVDDLVVRMAGKKAVLKVEKSVERLVEMRVD